MTQIIAAGIDLGGTKAEARLFDADWEAVATERLPTPDTYDDLLAALVALARWADGQTGKPVPLGLGTAGVLHPATRLITAANLASDGQALGNDLSLAVERHVTVLNDCAALALSEAHFGAGVDADRMLALVIGTGVSAATVVNGALQSGFTGTLGEVGHIAAPAHLVARYDLPLSDACGQVGAIETLISGPGLTRIGEVVMGHAMSPEDIVARKGSEDHAAKVWTIWCALVADLLRTLMRTVDPDCIVLGGGLSAVQGVAEDLSAALRPLQFNGFPIPQITIAKGGPTSGARGAAFAAWQATQ
ncbi:MAG: ROK family protein [Pseudomonadota bacterium]